MLRSPSSTRGPGSCSSAPVNFLSWMPFQTGTNDRCVVPMVSGPVGVWTTAANPTRGSSWSQMSCLVPGSTTA